MKLFTTLLASAALATLSMTAVTADSTQSKTKTEEQNTMAIQDFADKYVTLWKTTDDAVRAEIAAELFAEDAQHHAAPANVSFVGRADILANVTKINKEAIQGAGLTFTGGRSLPNGNSVLVEWSAQAPNGQTVREGSDVLILNDAGQATTLYMFTSN